MAPMQQSDASARGTDIAIEQKPRNKAGITWCPEKGPVLVLSALLWPLLLQCMEPPESWHTSCGQ